MKHILKKIIILTYTLASLFLIACKSNYVIVENRGKNIGSDAYKNLDIPLELYFKNVFELHPNPSRSERKHFNLYDKKCFTLNP
ncbi:MAG: hypothetical protein HC892_15135 [Saprospiraceae bacterium]|nr:hypothetical protein [Saprospiraceae bacterium]